MLLFLQSVETHGKPTRCQPLHRWNALAGDVVSEFVGEGGKVSGAKLKLGMPSGEQTVVSSSSREKGDGQTVMS